MRDARLNSGYFLLVGMVCSSICLSACATVNRAGYEKTKAPAGECIVEFSRPTPKLNNDTTLPVLGDVQIKGSRWVRNSCIESRLLEILKSEACSQGGNLVVITEAKGPDFWSPCLRAKGKILKVGLDSLDHYKDRHYSHFAIERRSQNQSNWQMGARVAGYTSSVTAVMVMILMGIGFIN